MRMCGWLAVAALVLACGARRDRAPARGDGDGGVVGLAGPDEVVYRMSPVLTDGTLTALAVEVHFRAAAGGSTGLRLPSRWASERSLWTYVRDLTIDGADDVREDGPELRVIGAAAGTPLVARYHVVSAFADDPDSTAGQPFAPIIRPTWFYAFGHALFALPELAPTTAVRFIWHGAPPGFGFASDIEHLAAGAPLQQIVDSIAVGGPALVVTGDRDATRIAVVGDYSFETGDFIADAHAILAAERELWGDRETPFVVAMVPLRAVGGHRSLGGTGLGDAFALTVSSDSALDDLRTLIAHEYFHTWSPSQLGGQRSGDDGMTGKWFAEGFTDFYAIRILLRLGLISLDDFVARWNEVLLAYATSPVRNLRNADIAAGYWTDRDINKLPYRRGQLLAARWEYQLRAATGGRANLDVVLRSLRIPHSIDAAQGAEDAADRFPRAYAAAGGHSVEDDLARLVTHGETIRLAPDTFGPCLRVTTPSDDAPQELVLVTSLTPDQRAACVRDLAGQPAAAPPP